jgi:hypothetical protein
MYWRRASIWGLPKMPKRGMPIQHHQSLQKRAGLEGDFPDIALLKHAVAHALGYQFRKRIRRGRFACHEVARALTSAWAAS